MARLLVTSSVLAAGIITGVVMSGVMSRTESGLAAPPPPAQSAPAPGPASDLTVAAERALQSVVNISSTSLVREPLFRDFFGNALGYTERQASSLGSGVIVSADG